MPSSALHQSATLLSPTAASEVPCPDHSPTARTPHSSSQSHPSPPPHPHWLLPLPQCQHLRTGTSVSLCTERPHTVADMTQAPGPSYSMGRPPAHPDSWCPAPHSSQLTGLTCQMKPFTSPRVHPLLYLTGTLSACGRPLQGSAATEQALGFPGVTAPVCSVYIDKAR